MTAPGPQEVSRPEDRAISFLRHRFEALGYDFVPEPDPSSLPVFLAGYRPDAVATRGTEQVAIEIKTRGYNSERIAALHSRFVGQPNWRLAVAIVDDSLPDENPIPVPKIEELRGAVARVEALLAQGHAEPALLMSFALLEAAHNLANGNKDDRFLKPGTVVQSLAMEGLIDREVERRLRSIITARNSIAHGSIKTRVKPDDVGLVLTTVERVLASVFAI